MQDSRADELRASLTVLNVDFVLAVVVGAFVQLPESHPIQDDIAATEDGIAALAKIAADVNQAVENIGARRLYTVMERVFEELSFTAPDRSGDKVTVNAAFVDENLGELMKSADVSRYVL